MIMGLTADFLSEKEVANKETKMQGLLGDKNWTRRK